MEGIHSASDSYLGYIFQGYYALVILLEEENDEAKLSIETKDDIYLDSLEKGLYQVKHRNKEIKTLNIKSVDLWKTLRIWCQEKDLKGKKFFLITCDKVEESSVLKELKEGIRGNSSIDKIDDALFKEAKRVMIERSANKNKHESRYKGCEAFVLLDEKERKKLIKNIYIKAKIDNIHNFEEVIEEKIKLSVKKSIRKDAAKLLLQWWERRVTLSLRPGDNEAKEISKNELLTELNNIVTMINREEFIIDIDSRNISESEEISARSKGSMMIRQLDLINAKPGRRRIALRDFWNTRKQRGKWLDKDPSVYIKLENFEKDLEMFWGDEFYRKLDDYVDADLKAKEKAGIEIFDYCTNDIVTKLSPKQDEWRHQFFVSGTYQILANQLSVGWHFDYKEKLGEENE